MSGLWICVGMQLLKVLEISRFPACMVSAYANVAQGSEYAWIWLNNALWQGSENTWSKFHRVLNNPRFKIFQGSESGKVANIRGFHRVLDMPEHTLTMSEYGWIYLNNLESNCVIYLKKQNSECVWCSTKNQWSLNKLLSSYQEEVYSEHFQILIMERFAQRKMPECCCATRNPHGKRGWGVCGTRALIKNTRKRVPVEKHFGNFPGSEYAWSSYMFGRPLQMPWVLNEPDFWILHSCKCMPDYGFIRLNNVWICPSIP